MLTVAAKVARYFTVAAYMLVCMWAVFGVGQASSAGGFFVAVVALLAVFGVFARWSDIVAAAEYGCRISESRDSVVTRVVTTVIAAVIGAAVAYFFYYLSGLAGEGSAWWYVARYLMAGSVFAAWSNVFCGLFALDSAEGKRMRRAFR